MNQDTKIGDRILRVFNSLSDRISDTLDALEEFPEARILALMLEVFTFHVSQVKTYLSLHPEMTLNEVVAADLLTVRSLLVATLAIGKSITKEGRGNVVATMLQGHDYLRELVEDDINNPNLHLMV